MKTVNGVPVIGVERAPWKHDDDEHVRQNAQGRGIVWFQGGGKSDALVLAHHAVIWERQGERFRAFEMPYPQTGRDPARQPITRDTWSIAVPGVINGTMLRVEMFAHRDEPNPMVSVELVADYGDGPNRVRMKVRAAELRSLLGVVGHWPGVGRG